MSLDAVVFHSTCVLSANVARCSRFPFFVLHISECRYTSCCTYQFGSKLAIVVSCCQAPPLTRLIMGGWTLAQKVVFWLKSFCSTSFLRANVLFRSISFDQKMATVKNGYSPKWLQSKMATVNGANVAACMLACMVVVLTSWVPGNHHRHSTCWLTLLAMGMEELGKWYCHH